MHDSDLLRIGELSRRSGVSPELLRAWERRYRLLRPTRSPGGLRLYSHGDLERVRLMQHHLTRGLAAAEAAALAAEQPRAASGADTPLGGREGRAGRRVGGVRRASGSWRARFAAGDSDDRRRARDGRDAVPARAGRAVGARRRVSRRGALCIRRAARPPAGARAWVGTGGRAARRARVRAGRAARPRADRVRPRAARARLARRLPRRRHTAHERRGRGACIRRRVRRHQRSHAEAVPCDTATSCARSRAHSVSASPAPARRRRGSTSTRRS